MNRRILAASMLMAVSLCATQAVQASPLAVRIPVQAKFGKTKTVSFSLRNDSTAPLKLIAGASAMTLEPGKTADTKLAIGDKVVVQDASGNHAAGTVLAVASPDLSGTTVAIR